MNASELYKKARSLQDSDKDFHKALEVYKLLIQQFPNSSEADYAKNHIDTIKKQLVDQPETATSPAKPSKAQRESVFSAPATMSKSDMRFPVLRTLSGIYRGVGWIVTGLACLGTLVAIVRFADSKPISGIYTFVSSIGGGLAGLTFVAIGEWTKVFLAIEENTRK